MPLEGSCDALPAAPGEVTAADSEPGAVGSVGPRGLGVAPAPPPPLVAATVTDPFMKG